MANNMKRLYKRLKKRLWSITHAYPRLVRCNVCGWRGSRLFSDKWHPYTTCPRCESQVRHRLLFAALEMIPGLSVKDLAQDKRILHFAPEPVIAKLLIEASSKYVSADFTREGVDMKLDMCNMSSIADGSFDLLVACDVLEHVPNDSSALSEIRRVLAPNGWLILTVPQKDGLASKYEDSSLTTPEERKRAFGRGDHFRIYGKDFDAFLIGHGFEVTTVDEKSFRLETVQKHVLFPPLLSTHPLATNYRKVYFAGKSTT